MTKEEYLSMYNIIGTAMEVHRQLGRGLDELIYHEALTMELTSNNILVENEKKLSIFYKGKKMKKHYFADMYYHGLIIELKSTSSIISDHRAQLMNYMRTSHTNRGLLLNFGEKNYIQKDIYTFPKKMISFYSTKTITKNMLKIKNILPFIIQIILIIPIGELAAQPITLDSCKAFALRNNATVQNALLDVQAAEQVKKQAFTKYFPTVSATALGYHALNPLLELGIDDIGNAQARNYLYDLYAEYGSAMGLPNSIDFCKRGLSVGATLMQPVFAGGRIINGNKLATVGVEAAKLQSELSQEQILLSLEENYWLIVSLYEKRQTVMQALVLLDTLHHDVVTAQEAGLATTNDILKVTLKENEMRSNLLKVENGIALATMALCQLTGIPYSPDLTLSDTVVVVEADLTTDISTVVAQRKESALLDMSVRAEQLKKKMMIGEALPQVAVGAGATYGSMVFDRYSANGLAFATVQVPLTNWWETSHKIKEQNIRIQQAENTRADLTGKMALEVQQAVNNVQEAYAQIALAESTVRDASANLATARVNFEAGLIPVSELLEAQTLHRQALDQLTDARINYRNKCAKLSTLVAAS